jgi:hypothetical protein
MVLLGLEADLNCHAMVFTIRSWLDQKSEISVPSRIESSFCSDSSPAYGEFGVANGKRVPVLP